jgi:tRNA (guanine-N7-)-methyltransferase
VRVVTGDVEALLQRLFAPGSLAEVFVNHPCPWPKARHVQRRLLARPFLERLAERMQTGARLSVVTDHAGYAAWLAGELESQRSLASCHATSEVAELPGRTPTKYQLKAMAAGIPIHYFEWRKVVPGPAWTGAPVEPRALMPTLTLAGSFDPAALFADFRPRLFREQHQGVEIAVRLESVFHRLEAPHWLVQALAQEDRLRQHFGIEVVERGGDALLLKLSEIGLPYPTHGVRRALWLVGEELRARFPELRVRHESLGLG